jgi:hypothetical protein
MNSGINNTPGRQVARDYLVRNNVSEQLKETKDKDREKKYSAISNSDSDEESEGIETGVTGENAKSSKGNSVTEKRKASRESTDSDDPADSFVSGKSGGKDENAVDEKELTVLLYLDGSKDFISEDLARTLIDLERIGSTDDINLVAQLNRKEDPSTDPEERLDNGWTGSRRYYITKNNDPNFKEIDLDRILKVTENNLEYPTSLEMMSRINKIMGNDEKAREYFTKADEAKEKLKTLSKEERNEISSKFGSEFEAEFGNIEDPINRMWEFEKAGETRITSPVLEELSELSEDKGAETLQNFIEWGIENHPAKNYVLVTSGHGHPISGLQSIPTTTEMNQAITGGLKNANEKTGRNDSIDALVLQSCNMGNLETMHELKDSADIIIASQLVTTSQASYKWDDIFSQVQKNIDKRGNFEVRQFAKDIVDYFKVEEDDEPGKLQRKGFFTISAIDTGKIPDLMNSFNSFLETCEKENVSDEQLFKAVAKSESFIELEQYLQIVHGTLILKDFGTFLHNMKEAEDSPESVKKAAKDVLEKLEETVIENESVNGYTCYNTLFVENATGLSFIAPDNAVDTLAQAESYVKKLPNFIKDSLWDDKLKEATNNIPLELRNEAMAKCISLVDIQLTNPENLSEEQKAKLEAEPDWEKEAKELKEKTSFFDVDAFREERAKEK